jgi:hypothetical protein
LKFYFNYCFFNRLIDKSGNHNHVPVILHSQSNGEVSTLLPLPPPPLINDTKTEISRNETADTKMAFIVDSMVSKLIDVASGGTGIHQTNSNTYGSSTQNESLKQLLNKSLSSTKLSSLPDAGLNNLPLLLSGRPISSDICHFVAHTAGELSHLLIDEIKIIHKEELVVVFE